VKSDFNPEQITLPPELEGKLFLTTREFAALAHVTRECVYGWAKAGAYLPPSFQASLPHGS